MIRYTILLKIGGFFNLKRNLSVSQKHKKSPLQGLEACWIFLLCDTNGNKQRLIS